MRAIKQDNDAHAWFSPFFGNFDGAIFWRKNFTLKQLMLKHVLCCYSWFDNTIYCQYEKLKQCDNWLMTTSIPGEWSAEEEVALFDTESLLSVATTQSGSKLTEMIKKEKEY